MSIHADHAAWLKTAISAEEQELGKIVAERLKDHDDRSLAIARGQAVRDLLESLRGCLERFSQP